MSRATRRDVEKERHWQKVIREAARSGLSIREFCRGRRLRESQFHWWQRKLKERRQERTLRQRRGTKNGSDGQATFALVSEDGDASEAGIELSRGWRRKRYRLPEASLPSGSAEVDG